jgi:hypothetical protein
MQTHAKVGCLFLESDSLILFFIKLGIWLPLLLIIDCYSSLTRWFCFVVIARIRNVDAIYVNGNCFILFLQHAECIPPFHRGSTILPSLPFDTESIKYSFWSNHRRT